MEDLVPPKGIVNSAQLHMELTRMFANAVAFNPLPTSERGFGRSLKLRKRGGRALRDGEVRRSRRLQQGEPEEDVSQSREVSESATAATNDTAESSDLSSADERGIISDAREMFEDVEKLVTKWRELEEEKMHQAGVVSPPQQLQKGMVVSLPLLLLTPMRLETEMAPQRWALERDGKSYDNRGRMARTRPCPRREPTRPRRPSNLALQSAGRVDALRQWREYHAWVAERKSAAISKTSTGAEQTEDDKRIETPTTEHPGYYAETYPEWSTHVKVIKTGSTGPHPISKQERYTDVAREVNEINQKITTASREEAVKYKRRIQTLKEDNFIYDDSSDEDSEEEKEEEEVGIEVPAINNQFNDEERPQQRERAKADESAAKKRKHRGDDEVWQKSIRVELPVRTKGV
ncbi:hypothetical protein LTR66_015707 [Elasticomyces elasticus]|nr:hypothetical protein LTR66_015707 [Elasticomyces elasticus]